MVVFCEGQSLLLSDIVIINTIKLNSTNELSTVVYSTQLKWCWKAKCETMWPDLREDGWSWVMALKIGSWPSCCSNCSAKLWNTFQISCLFLQNQILFWICTRSLRALTARSCLALVAAFIIATLRQIAYLPLSPFPSLSLTLCVSHARTQGSA